VVSGGDDEAAMVCIPRALSVWGCDGGLPLGRWHVSVACNMHHACVCGLCAGFGCGSGSGGLLAWVVAACMHSPGVGDGNRDGDGVAGSGWLFRVFSGAVMAVEGKLVGCSSVD
jgi:hypothetical protein